MLKGIDPALSAELLHVLMLMGHGDDLVVCDVNHPAASIAKHTTYGKLIDMSGCDLPRAAAAILTLMPLDTFVEDRRSRECHVELDDVGLPHIHHGIAHHARFARRLGTVLQLKNIDAPRRRRVVIQRINDRKIV